MSNLRAGILLVAAIVVPAACTSSSGSSRDPVHNETGGAGHGGQASQAGTSGQAGATSNGGVSPSGGSTAGSGGGTAATGGAAGGGGSSGGSAGAAPAGGSSGTACPTEPPFDDSDTDLVSRCTEPIVMAVGNGLRRAATHDGITWFGEVWMPNPSFTDQNEESHRDVLIANGLIVISGDGGILTSRDGGLTFTRKDTGRSLHNSAIAFVAGAFWVVGDGAHTSTDGITWKSYTPDATLPGGLKAGFSPNVAARDGKRALFMSGDKYRLFDGATWVQGTIPGVGSLQRLIYGNGRFLLIGGACCGQSLAGLRATSTDGVTWTVVTDATSSGPDLRFGDVVWNGAAFFASGSSYDMRVQTSTDGLEWKVIGSNLGVDALGRLGDGYVGARGGTFHLSTDGRIWNTPHQALGDNKWWFTRITSGRVLKKN